MRAISLEFHDVVPEGNWELSGFQGPGADIYKLSCEMFSRHLAAIASQRPDPPVVAGTLLAGEAKPDSVLLTFDDGGAGALPYTADMLDERGWKGHFFIVTDRIGSRGFLGAGQIRELRDRGHVIGSHSCSHPTRMAHCTAAELDSEWSRSVQELASILGEPVQVGSVPGGYYARRVAASAARAGIRILFNSEPVRRVTEVDGCLVAGRFNAKRESPPEWSAGLVRGRWPLYLREYCFWNAKKCAKTLLGPAWLGVRRRVLGNR